MYAENILDAIGNTPMVEIKKLNPNPSVKILAKLEGGNPSGSVKDRAAKYMVEDAEAKGLLKPGKIVLEPTSGNTGVALAMISAVKGYKFAAVMPKNISLEKKKLIRAYGGEVILSDGKRGTNGAIEVARRLVRDKRYVMLDQFSNPANVLAHYETTGAEIIRDVPEIDIFVAGVGTGGTIVGTSRRLKEYNSRIKIVGVEPALGSQIPGIRNMSEGFIPEIFDETIVDRKLVVEDRDAVDTVRKLFLEEGLSVGISSGAAMWAALQIAREIKEGAIVVLFPDGGERYLSTGVFSRDRG
jgi:cysteine synthase